MSTSVSATDAAPRQSREEFTGRWAFILAAIGSAVGLGNIWRFPYVAYENGGGAFVVPYLIALLTAGIPLLFFDYAIGHRFRGSAPLAFRRLNRWAEAIGWWQVLICVVIGIYYAAIIAWSIRYTGFSLTQEWGDDPEGFFNGTYLQVADAPQPSFDIVPGVFWPMLAVWVILILVMGFGIRRGVALASMIGIPLLIVMFLVLVVIALTLPGATQGLDALFTPNWAALAEPGVWIAAYGQIFFSLSVGFGIMITYASYLKKRTNLTGSGLVVGLSNSGFEILAGIGVFSALGFMAQASGVRVDEVVASGIGLAFVAFPTLISQAPMGAVVGILFFGSLVIAGFTSLISILEVVVSAVKDKLGWGRWTTVLVVVGLSAVVSLALFSTTTGLYMLDTMDAFANNFGIVGAALMSVLVVTAVLGSARRIVAHLNAVSSFRVGGIFTLLIGVVMPLVLSYIWLSWIMETIRDGYGDYPGDFLGQYGWGLALGSVAFAVLLSLIPWSKKSNLYEEPVENEIHGDLIPTHAVPAGTTPTGAIPVVRTDTTDPSVDAAARAVRKEH